MIIIELGALIYVGSKVFYKIFLIVQTGLIHAQALRSIQLKDLVNIYQDLEFVDGTPILSVNKLIP